MNLGVHVYAAHDGLRNSVAVVFYHELRMQFTGPGQVTVVARKARVPLRYSTKKGLPNGGHYGERHDLAGALERPEPAWLPPPQALS